MNSPTGTSEPPGLVVLRGAELHAPAPRGRCDVLVGGGRVLAIAPSLDGAASALGAEEVSLDGRALAPGLIDAHAHVTGGGGEAGFSTRVPPIALTALARAGVTSVVGVLGTDGTTRTMADLVARTLGLREEGLSAWCYTGSYQLPLVTLTGSVRSDVVFVDPIVGVGELAISDHRSSQPTFDELVRIASDCHVAGMTSGKAGLVHLHVGDGRRGLALVRRALDETELPPSVFQPTHVNRKRRLWREAVALAKERGLPIDVTAFPPPPPASAISDEDELAADEALAECLRDSSFPTSLLTCSSDACGCLPVFDEDGRLVEMDVGRPSLLADTLHALVVRHRLPLGQALAPFTSNVAARLRLARKGRIAIGADADLVVLDSAARPTDVMAGGRWLVRDGESIVKGTFEPR